MLRITKKGTGFKLALLSSNGKEVFKPKTFTQKPSVWTNIKVVLKMFKGKEILVQDDTTRGGESIVYKVTSKVIKETNIKPKK